VETVRWSLRRQPRLQGSPSSSSATISAPPRPSTSTALEDGFKWYITGLPFGFQGSRKKAYRVSDGILSFNPDINLAQLSSLSAIVPRGSRKPVGWYIDREVVIFGSGPEMPFKLDWVRVWVKP
jgi:hypothetical protein